MKRLITALATTLLLVGCLSNQNIKPLPPGAKACSSDLDCSEYEYCGFRGVDTPAQCIWSGRRRWP